MAGGFYPNFVTTLLFQCDGHEISRSMYAVQVRTFPSVFFNPLALQLLEVDAHY